MKPSSGKEREKIDFNAYNLRPVGSYIDSLTTDFASLLGDMEKAENAANALLKETADKTKDSKAPEGEVASSGDVPTALPKTKAEQDPKKPSLDELMAQLDALVGLAKIKSNVKSLINLVKVRKLREENELPVPPMSLHLVFMGNPGTGKTTVARLLSQVYCAIGVLSKGQLVEVDRSGLVAGFVGQTAIKTGEVIKSALGGVLFIDEAYSLAVQSEGSNDFGHEAIETLLKAMEDNRSDLVVIVAGYENLMEKFISSNPGLESRFNRYLLFEDYNGQELYDIFCSMCKKNSYVLGDAAVESAKKQFQDLYETRDENFGNARHVRNVFENVVSVHSDRVAALPSPTRDDLMTVAPEDVDKAFLMSQNS